MAGGIARVGFVGLGRMGWPMARRLAEAGFTLSVHDAVPGRAAAFAGAHGARAAADPADCAADAEAFVTMLPTSREVAEVLHAAAPRLAPGALVIEMSSGEPAATRALSEALAARGIGMLDAPVSGGVARAETGELAIMAGGDAASLDRAMPLLRALGTAVTHCGAIGAGQAMKALNNLVSAAGFLASVEALLIGSRFGLDPATMVDVLNASTGMNNSTQKKLRQFVLSRGFDSGFGLDLMVKDLTIALSVGRETATPAPLSAQVREMWASAAAMLGPGQDHTAAARFSEALAAHELASAQVQRKG